MITVNEIDIIRIKEWIIRAAKLREREFPKDQLSHRQWRDQITAKYYGISSYAQLCQLLSNGVCPPRKIPVFTGGIHDLRTPNGESLSFDGIVELIGPHCKDEKIREKLIRKLNEMNEQRLQPNSVYRIGKDIFDRMFVLLFDIPYGQPVKPSDTPTGKLKLDVRNRRVTGMAVAYI